jgi:conjugal transfer/entry exclusion protein
MEPTVVWMLKTASELDGSGDHDCADLFDSIAMGELQKLAQRVRAIPSFNKHFLSEAFPAASAVQTHGGARDSKELLTDLVNVKGPQGYGQATANLGRNVGQQALDVFLAIIADDPRIHGLVVSKVQGAASKIDQTAFRSVLPTIDALIAKVGSSAARQILSRAASVLGPAGLAASAAQIGWDLGQVINQVPWVQRQQQHLGNAIGNALGSSASAASVDYTTPRPEATSMIQQLESRIRSKSSTPDAEYKALLANMSIDKVVKFQALNHLRKNYQNQLNPVQASSTPHANAQHGQAEREQSQTERFLEERRQAPAASPSANKNEFHKL